MDEIAKNRNIAAWDELDVIRGVAAVFMVANHAGYCWLSPEQMAWRSLDILLFVSSFAPVLFFFVTGVGYGVGAIGRRLPAAHHYGYVNKVLILLVADEALSLRSGRWIGVDFLGFIALSMLVLEFLRRLRRPAVCAAVMLAGIVFIRFVLGPALRTAIPVGGVAGWVRFALGTGSIPGFGYPPGPWLAYPLSGFLLGLAAQRHRDWIMANRRTWIAAAAVVGTVIAIVGWGISRHGIPATRWGMMSLSFFVDGFGVLGLSVAVAALACSQRGRYEAWRLISLRGISSLAVVPVHYAIIAMLRSAAVSERGIAGFAGWLILAVLCTMLFSKGIGVLSDNVRRIGNQSTLWMILIALVVCCLVGTARSTGGASMAWSTACQIVLCLLLVVRPGLVWGRAWMSPRKEIQST